MSELKAGDKVWVSDTSEHCAKKNKNEQFFIGKTSNGHYVTEYNDGYVTTWKYAVKAEPEFVDVGIDKIECDGDGFQCPICMKTIGYGFVLHKHFDGYVNGEGILDFQHCRNAVGNICEYVRFKEGGE